MKAVKAFRLFLVLLILSVFYLPLFHLFSKAFIFEGRFSFHWFKELFFDSSFWSALSNSFFVAVISSFLSVVMSLFCVIYFAKKQTTWLDQIMALALTFPEIILALSSLSLFVLVKAPLGLGTVIVGHTTLTLAFSYFILSLQMKRLDPAILEAAWDLGADSKEMRAEILMPWLKTSIISSFALCFLLSFDDFLISYFVSGVGQETLPIKLFSMLKIGISPTVNALSVLILFFTFLSFLVCYPLFQNLGKSAVGTQRKGQ